MLIIEDEPLIAMQLEDVVGALGHTICRTAATRSQAREVVEAQMPGLVLADIQLADGSSGLDAVDDILALGRRTGDLHHRLSRTLLTGDRPDRPILSPSRFRKPACAPRSARRFSFNRGKPLG